MIFAAMSEITQSFTDKLFTAYEENAKFRALENAVTHNGLLKSLETRQSEIENNHVFSIDLTKDEEILNLKQQIVELQQVKPNWSLFKFLNK